MLDPNFDPLSELRQCQVDIHNLKQDLHLLAVSHNRNQHIIQQMTHHLETASRHIRDLSSLAHRQSEEIEKIKQSIGDIDTSE